MNTASLKDIYVQIEYAGYCCKKSFVTLSLVCPHLHFADFLVVANFDPKIGIKK